MLQLAVAAVLFTAPALPTTTEPAAKPEPTVASQAPAPAAAPAKATKAAKAEKLICRREESTGSRTDRGKVCMTMKQWKEYDRSN